MDGSAERPRVVTPSAAPRTVSECPASRFEACIRRFPDVVPTPDGGKLPTPHPVFSYPPSGRPMQGGNMHLRRIVLLGGCLAALAAGSAQACPDPSASSAVSATR